MLSGETVLVSLRTFGEEDAYGNRAEVYSEPKSVANVLCGRGSSSLPGQGGAPHADGQPYYVRSDKRFCFPKGYADDLTGAIITWGGEDYEVLGPPVVSTEENMPPSVPWNLRVEAVRRDG